MTKGEGMTPEEYIAKLEEEVESRKEYQRRSQSVDGEHIENLLGEKYKLEEENKKLKEEVKDLVERNIELDKKYMLVLTENKKLKETIKDHQLYEEKLEHRIIEFEELLHGE